TPSNRHRAIDTEQSTPSNRHGAIDMTMPPGNRAGSPASTPNKTASPIDPIPGHSSMASSEQVARGAASRREHSPHLAAVYTVLITSALALIAIAGCAAGSPRDSVTIAGQTVARKQIANLIDLADDTFRRAA